MGPLSDKPPERWTEREYYELLVRAAWASGELTEAEAALLRSLADDLRIKPLTALAIIDRVEGEVFKSPSPPRDSEQRSAILQSLCEVVWADKRLTPGEKALLERVRTQFELPEGKLDVILANIQRGRSGRRLETLSRLLQ